LRKQLDPALFRAQRRSTLTAVIVKAQRHTDERLHTAGPVREKLNKVFPDHWSFMLGEIALYCLIILILTGTYLTFFFDPSDAKAAYHGRYIPLDGVTASKAYSSTLEIAFDVRGGLLIRQIHHWAALMFVAAILIHMSRIFFTGAFRKPREVNWVIGVSLLVLAIIEGFCGYSLPDDLLSGMGLRIAYSIMQSIPIVGTWLVFLIFGGPFPGTHILGRLYIAHVLLIPGLIVALVGLHLAIVVRQKHTEFPAPGHEETTVSGDRVYPVYGAKSLGFFAILAGVLAGLGGLVQINPVWLWGPYSPAQQTSFAQPDWYMFFVEGALRLFPPWQIEIFHHDIPAPFWPGVVLPTLLFAVLLFYPFLERRFTLDKRRHNLLQRPRDAPVRTGLGVMWLSFFFMLTIWGADDAMMRYFHLDLEAVVWVGRVIVPLIPILLFLAVRRLCHRLQERDERRRQTGDETGVLVPLEGGGYAEVTEPAKVHASANPGLPPEP
jgi:ubiquinol-cytochrome c reductase cytochrome b subunit